MRFQSSKDPDDILDYEVDWSARIGDGDSIVGSTFTVIQGTVAIDSDTISEDQLKTIMWVSGGQDNEEASIQNRVITSLGRRMDQTLKLRIRSR